MPQEGLWDRFLCCCVNTGGSAEHVGISGDIFGGGGRGSGGQYEAQASYPSQSTSPQFRTNQAGSPLGGREFLDGGQASHREMNTARSAASAGSSMSPEEKEREKGRLQKLVKDFAKEAVTGIAVSLVNPETARQSPHFFQMDRYLTVFSLKPKDGSTAESSVQDFNVKDLTSIYKGAEVSTKAPSLGSIALFCVGLDTNRADRHLFFHFDEPVERDKFYTCLKILRMSVDINRS